MKWQRLTILDFLLLMVAYALAGGFVSEESELAVAGNIGKFTHYTEMFFQIVVLGNAFACPIVLAAQYAFRRRRTWLSEGEWLGLAPIILWTIALCLPRGDPALALLMVLLAFLAICSSLAFLLIGLRLCGLWSFATCRWTDVFGAFTCLAMGSWVYYNLTAHPPVI